MQNLLRWAQNASVIVMPTRKPEAVAETWAKRGEKHEHFYAMWRNWQHFVELGALIIPVDMPGIRDRALMELSNRIGVRLETDWAPHNMTEINKGVVPAQVGALYDIPQIRSIYG